MNLTMKNNIITEKDFNSLYDETISHKDYHKIINEIEDRVSDILNDLYENKHIDLEWYCFSNGNEDEESCPGNFDPQIYKDKIELIGDINIEEYVSNLSGSSHTRSIPTRWLWEEGYLEECKNAQISFNKKKAALKILQKSKREELKTKKQIAIDSIKLKLTKDELKFVKFK